jgi:hypothetical protein
MDSNPPKPIRGHLHDWRRVGCAGGLGYAIEGTLADGSTLLTGTVYTEYRPPINKRLGDVFGWIETLTWCYILHGDAQ